MSENAIMQLNSYIVHCNFIAPVTLIQQFHIALFFHFLAYCGQFFLNLLTMTLTNKFLLFALQEKEFNCVIITKRINGYFCEEKKLHQNHIHDHRLWFSRKGCSMGYF